MTERFLSHIADVLADRLNVDTTEPVGVTDTVTATVSDTLTAIGVPVVAVTYQLSHRGASTATVTVTAADKTYALLQAQTLQRRLHTATGRCWQVHVITHH